MMGKMVDRIQISTIVEFNNL